MEGCFLLFAKRKCVCGFYFIFYFYFSPETHSWQGLSAGHAMHQATKVGWVMNKPFPCGNFFFFLVWIVSMTWLTGQLPKRISQCRQG